MHDKHTRQQKILPRRIPSTATATASPTLTGNPPTTLRAPRTYRLEYTDDLTTNQWHPLTEPIPGDGKPVIVEDPAATNRPQRFYRLKLIQP